jgi:hypothetical protein
LEKEKGGSGLRYSFDIKRGAVVHEVGVDAQTGAVLENAKEGSHPDKDQRKPGGSIDPPGRLHFECASRMRHDFAS